MTRKALNIFFLYAFTLKYSWKIILALIQISPSWSLLWKRWSVWSNIPCVPVHFPEPPLFPFSCGHLGQSLTNCVTRRWRRATHTAVRQIILDYSNPLNFKAMLILAVHIIHLKWYPILDNSVVTPQFCNLKKLQNFSTLNYTAYPTLWK